MNENDSPVSSKDDIRRTRQIPSVQTEAQTGMMKDSADGDFWPCILSLNASHHATSRRAVNYISHELLQ